MSELAWMFVAFSAVWIGIGIYVLSLGLRQRKLESRLAELERKD
jgi:CcmD family protein